MNKRKLMTIAMALSMVAILAVGATIAYFTDVADKQTNVFSIGGVEIELTEETGITGPGTIERGDNGSTWSDIMPGSEMKKEVTVKNTGNSEAYVRVAVKINNLSEIDKALDDFYEAKLGKDNHEEIEKMYDLVFKGFAMKHNYEMEGDARRGARHWLDASKHQGGEGVTLINIDHTYYIRDLNALTSQNNLMKTEYEENLPSYDAYCLYAGNVDKGYYSSKLNGNENLYVFYLKMEAGKSYKLFDGLSCPAEFNEEQAQMFEDLKIEVTATAIQTAGFEGDTEKAKAVAAFTALDAEYDIFGTKVVK